MRLSVGSVGSPRLSPTLCPQHCGPFTAAQLVLDLLIYQYHIPLIRAVKVCRSGAHACRSGNKKLVCRKDIDFGGSSLSSLSLLSRKKIPRVYPMGAQLSILLRAVHPGTIAMTDFRQGLRPKVLTRHLGDL